MGGGPEYVSGVYHRQAQNWDKNRGRFGIEIPWLIRLTHRVPRGGAVLDLGCGAGDPVGTWLLAQGFALTGLDQSRPLLEIAQARLPGARLIEGDMRALALDQRFEAIVSWDAFFHLDPQAQVATLPLIVQHLTPGGRLLLTVGPRAGSAVGRVGDEPIYHASLAPDHYAQILTQAGAPIERFVPEDPQTDRHSVILARKTCKAAFP